jgi:ATP-dependent helicase HrpB
LDPGAARRAYKAAQQIQRMARGAVKATEPEKETGSEKVVLRTILAGFPDRIAVRRAGKGNDYQMVGGRGAVLSGESTVRDADLLVGLQLEGGQRGIHKKSLIRMASRVELDWLREDYPELLENEESLDFDRIAQRVMGVRRLLFDRLPLNEVPITHFDPVHAAARLARAVAEDPSSALAIDGECEALMNRVNCLREWMPELKLPPLDREALIGLLPAICAGKKSFAETRSVKLRPLLEGLMDHHQREALARYAPSGIRLPGGRTVRLRYEPGRPPVLAVRLQEVFGLLETPCVARGRIRVLMDLLGPNMRTVQRTEDLASFWKNTYERVRKDLRGRYPKHDWPEDPLGVRKRD